MAVKALFSTLLSLIIAITTLPFSYFPNKCDTDFSVEEVSSYTPVICGETAEYVIDKENEWFNYYGIRYSAASCVKGKVLIDDGFGKSHSEAFFLEKAEDGVFYSFTDDFLTRKKSENILRISVTGAEDKNPDFKLLGVTLFNRSIPDEIVYVQNDKLKIGVNLSWGGALSYLEDLDSSVEAVIVDGKTVVDSSASSLYGTRAVNKNVNLINCHDTGRLVQQSYYGRVKEQGYQNGEYMGNVWPYNPVQGGNQFNETSKIVDLAVGDDYIYVKTRPLDWAKEGISITSSYMEATYTLDGGLLHTQCRFIDFSGYTFTRSNQEIPAFYCIEPLNRFVYCKDGKIVNVDGLGFWAESYPHFELSENWAAFTDERDGSFGIGILTPGKTDSVAGVFARGETTGKNPSASASTSYVAILDTFTLESFVPFTYEYYVTTGDVNEIRATFASVQ